MLAAASKRQGGLSPSCLITRKRNLHQIIQLYFSKAELAVILSRQAWPLSQSLHSAGNQLRPPLRTWWSSNLDLCCSTGMILSCFFPLSCRHNFPQRFIKLTVRSMLSCFKENFSWISLHKLKSKKISCLNVQICIAYFQNGLNTVFGMTLFCVQKYRLFGCCGGIN